MGRPSSATCERSQSSTGESYRSRHSACLIARLQTRAVGRGVAANEWYTSHWTCRNAPALESPLYRYHCRALVRAKVTGVRLSCVYDQAGILVLNRHCAVCHPTPAQVLHGGELVCLAFDFQAAVADTDAATRGRGMPGKRAPRFTYISDVSSIPDAVVDKLRSGPQIDVLVLDCLHYGKHFSHFGLDEAIAAARAIGPRRVLLVGMTCSIGDHAATNRRLRRLRTHPKVSVCRARACAASRAPVWRIAHGRRLPCGTAAPLVMPCRNMTHFAAAGWGGSSGHTARTRWPAPPPGITRRVLQTHARRLA